MNNSSQQDLYSITLDSNTLSDDVITISNNDIMYSTMNMNNVSYNYSSGGTITIGNVSSFNSSDTISTSYIDSLQGNLFNEEWVHTFPDWYKVKEMCDLYPSLEIAMRNLKTVYDLVKDDYDARKNQDSNT